MNIAIFIPFFWPERNGLINYVVGLYTTAKEKKLDLKFTVITFDSQHTNTLVTEEEFFRIYRLPCHILLGGTYVIPSLRGIREFWEMMKQERFDAVNTHTRFFVSSLLGLLLAKKQHIPLLHTEHGSTFVKDGSWLTRAVARIYDETFGRLILSSATNIFGVSNACIEFAKKLGGKNGTVIYNGIDTSFWHTDERQSNLLTKITFCGRMVKGKGVQDLLQALVNLVRTQDLVPLPNWELHLVGGGNYLEELRKLATELDLNNRIIWHGSQGREFLRDLLKTTDIFVNPSYTEGLPTSVLEAGAMRCAVIATDVGGTSEIIENGENGILIPAPVRESAAADSLQQALQTLLQSPEQQRKYGSAIAKTVAEKFAWNAIAETFLHHLPR